MGSYQAITGAFTTIVGGILGHKSQQATAVYSRFSLDPVRASREKAVEAMKVAADVPDKVTPIRQVGDQPFMITKKYNALALERSQKIMELQRYHIRRPCNLRLLRGLTVRLHQLVNRRSVNSVVHLCRELNDTRTIFPGTELRLVYELVSS